MLNLTDIAAANKATFDQFTGLGGQWLEGVEKLTALNLQVMKSSLTELADCTHAAWSTKDLGELATLQAATLQAAPDKAVAYGRQVKEILTAATAGQRASAQAQAVEVQARFLDAVNGLLKNAPGSENTVALVKSAVTAASEACEAWNKASLQALDAVDASVPKAEAPVAKPARASRTKSAA